MCLNHENNIKSNNKDLQELEHQLERRKFLTKTSLGLGALALGSLLNTEKAWSTVKGSDLGAANADSLLHSYNKNRLGLPHHLPKAKRIVYLFQSGGPSQLDMWDYKPKLKDFFGQDLPPSVRKGQRLTGMSAEQTTFPMAPSIFEFKQHGNYSKKINR